MAEEALVDGETDLGAFDLMSRALALKLPRELADLSDRLGWDGFAEARQATRSVDRQSATEGGRSGSHE